MKLHKQLPLALLQLTIAFTFVSRCVGLLTSESRFNDNIAVDLMAKNLSPPAPAMQRKMPLSLIGSYTDELKFLAGE